MDALTLKVKSLIEDVVYGMNVPIIKSNPYTVIQPDDEEDSGDNEGGGEDTGGGSEDTGGNPTPTPPDTRKIYVGTLDIATTGIVDMSKITGDHILALTKLSNGVYSKYTIAAPRNSILVVAVPLNRKVTIDNGLGGKVPFYTSVTIPNMEGPLYANGELTITIDSETYYIYGVFVFTQGNEYIYID